MANIVKTESGIDLLQRFSVRPKLIGLQAEVFGEDGPLPGDVIEINEKDTNLKTILLTHWIIKCILPATWKGVEIGGLGKVEEDSSAMSTTST
ncbi:putative XRCC3 [Daphnia sinensis]|uniref:XRCC3 n=1 Tax=Daphnia sinensis TaxID=1820382 RepID=A0AAD5PW84_9CRUS|nr:putative XRCC3 [Daphnia sinensis]